MTQHTERRVSVIIPARNEEGNIARAVRSVATQQPVREIIVVDDASTDRTSGIVQELAREIPTVRAIRLDDLPEGWTGKSHALAEGAKAASGVWLLFTDADTEHRAGSLAALLARAENERADLLSVSPGQRVVSWWEKAVIPFVFVRLARLYRFEEVSDIHSSAAAANGQYLLIRREVYERNGGHEAVRAEILEDVELARRVKNAGGRLIFLPGAEWVETRMYDSFVGMWNGWTKNLYLLFDRNLARISRTLVEVAFLDMILPLAFFALCLAMALGPANAGVAVVAVGFFLAALWRQWSYSAAIEGLGFDPRLANYLIIGAGLFNLLLMNSVLAYRSRGKVIWKGRKYSASQRPRGEP